MLGSLRSLEGQLSECIKKYLKCVLKMNGGLTGLERHEGE